ncbi:PilZ domain-containing protein [Aurantiacibacter sp. MUD11]|uniref:PilZ domain-containing protein n=1 Tax=Aurantiacibacter sp. MUD11 TaxID=3003265 RepID=UPI0022AA72B7|nr:PilZ domain-containing protein [Aurantiacibacter sp. MUD11]WAT17076.1 PilZ domain-containing protein [Aurantiacibacter sp. MUD11]
MRDAIRQDEYPAMPGSDVAGVEEQRSSPRLTLLIRAAKVITAEGEFLCVIRDASETGISLRVFHPLPQGADIVVELQNGDRYLAEIVWQEEERVGMRFTAPADISRIIESPSRFAKRSIRLNVDARAVVTSLRGADNVVIRNISQQGASIECRTRYAIDERVKLKARGLAETSAKVRWRKDSMVGLAFEDTYQFGELARIVRMLGRNN